MPAKLVCVEVAVDEKDDWACGKDCRYYRPHPEENRLPSCLLYPGASGSYAQLQPDADGKIIRCPSCLRGEEPTRHPRSIGAPCDRAASCPFAWKPHVCLGCVFKITEDQVKDGCWKPRPGKQCVYVAVCKYAQQATADDDPCKTCTVPMWEEAARDG